MRIVQLYSVLVSSVSASGSAVRTRCASHCDTKPGPSPRALTYLWCVYKLPKPDSEVVVLMQDSCRPGSYCMIVSSMALYSSLHL